MIVCTSQFPADFTSDIKFPSWLVSCLYIFQNVSCQEALKSTRTGSTVTTDFFSSGTGTMTITRNNDEADPGYTASSHFIGGEGKLQGMCMYTECYNWHSKFWIAWPRRQRMAAGVTYDTVCTFMHPCVFGIYGWLSSLRSQQGGVYERVAKVQKNRCAIFWRLRADSHKHTHPTKTPAASVVDGHMRTSLGKSNTKSNQTSPQMPHCWNVTLFQWRQITHSALYHHEMNHEVMRHSDVYEPAH